MAGTALRRIGIAATVFVGLLIIVLLGIYGISRSKMNRTYVIKAEALEFKSDSATMLQAQHLVSAISKCVECHGEDFGGTTMDLGPVGKFRASNLTSGKGGVAPMSDAEWIRAIRHGVRKDGHPLVFMPSSAFAAMDASDLASVIAYLKQLPPVDRELPPTQVGMLGRFLIVSKPGRLIQAEGIDHEAAVPAGVPHQPSAEYGRYLAVTGGCTYCHGDNLKGGLKDGPPGTPASADLTSTGQLANWGEEDFRRALRTGMRPDNTVINPFMPWRMTRLMTDDEIKAVWLYLKTL
ncbi:MAG TPA: cytochrome c [Gemmatimonadales bacterium]|nr:cytochrome c [Gemmatimonadales bacterium]